jgi:hypothetical protein
LTREARRRAFIASIVYALGIFAVPIAGRLTSGGEWSAVAGPAVLVVATLIGTILIAKSTPRFVRPVIISGVILAAAVVISAIVLKDPSRWSQAISVWGGCVGWFFAASLAGQRGKSPWGLVAASLVLAGGEIAAVLLTVA